MSLDPGAYFASRPLPPAFNSYGHELNVYAVPAILTLILLVLETIFLAVALPETRGKRAVKDVTQKSTNGVEDDTKNGTSANGRASTVEERIDTLKVLRRLHFLFLGIFSGIEFTLTFLTFDCESILLYAKV